MIAAALILGALAAEPATGTSEWPVRDDDPEASVPTVAQRERNPLQFGYWVMDLTDKGDAAVGRGDHEAAARYWRALARAVPDRSVAFAKMCASYRAIGAHASAVASCKAALARPGVAVDDFARYLEVVLDEEEPLGHDELADANAVLEHLRATDEGRRVAERFAPVVARKAPRRGFAPAWAIAAAAALVLAFTTISSRRNAAVGEAR